MIWPPCFAAPLSPCHPVELPVISNEDVLTNRDVPDVRDFDPSFRQLLPVVMGSNTNGRFCPLGRLGTIESVPDDTECHRGEKRVDVRW